MSANDVRTAGPGIEARAAVLGRISRLGSERVELLASLGCVLAGDVVSDIDVALFDDSAMDGYAIRAAAEGGHLRLKGEDVRVGETVLRAGEVVNAASVGLMAALGCAHVDVYRRPHVAIVSTGDELVGVTERTGPGQIRNSNAYSLAAQVLAAGGVPHLLGIARDNDADTRALLSRAPEFDIMLATGGSSMGDFDLIKDVLAEIGEPDHSMTPVRLGARLTWGAIGGTPFFGLPGNPTPTVVGFDLYIRPAIRKMRGFAELDRPRVAAVLAEPVHRRSERRCHMRGVIARSEGGAAPYEVVASGRRASAMLPAMRAANCLVLLPQGPNPVPAGTVVECIRLDADEGTP